MQVLGTVVAVRWLRLRVEGQKMPHHKIPMQNRQRLSADIFRIWLAIIGKCVH